MTGATLAYRWNGTGMDVLPRFQREADAEFVIGAVYRLTHIEDRQANSHRHYFAAIADAWANLPELVADQYPSPESLRKRALIKCGYYDQQSLVCKSNAEAVKVQAFMKPIDDFAVVTVAKNVVTRYTAKSQSMKAMGKEEFQKSKQAVLDLLADMIGTTPKALRDNSGSA